MTSLLPRFIWVPCIGHNWKLSLGVVRGTQKLNSQWDKGSRHVWEGKTNFGWEDQRSHLGGLDRVIWFRKVEIYVR